MGNIHSFNDVDSLEGLHKRRVFFLLELVKGTKMSQDAVTIDSGRTEKTDECSMFEVIEGDSSMGGWKNVGCGVDRVTRHGGEANSLVKKDLSLR